MESTECRHILECIIKQFTDINSGNYFLNWLEMYKEFKAQNKNKNNNL